MLPAARHYGLGLIPWSPLGGGLLGGVMQKMGQGRRASEHMVKQVENKRSQLEAWEKFCDDLDEKPGDVALAWLPHQDGVTGPIIGPRTMDQLEAALHTIESSLDEAALDRLDEIFPGPGGPAPEVYAW